MIMEGTIKQDPRSLKFTLKLRKDKTVDNSPSTADNLNNVEEEVNASNSFAVPKSGLATNSLDTLENQTPEDEKYSHLQMVLYDANDNRAHESGTVEDSIYQQTPLRRKHPFSDPTPRVLPSVGYFTVQCANCFKWRLVPTKEKYEEIREQVMEQPFFCERGRDWQPEMSCEDPPDKVQDNSGLWAIDKPNIAQPPPGWQRLLRIRGEGSTKFADVYYVAPSGKRLHSSTEIERYLEVHKEYKEGIASMSQFSFQTPRPLQENYVRKRTAWISPKNGSDDHGMPGSINPDEVCQIAWVSSDVNADLQPSGQELGPSLSEFPGSNPEHQSTKKGKKPSKQGSSGDVGFNRNEVRVEESQRI